MSKRVLWFSWFVVVALLACGSGGAGGGGGGGGGGWMEVLSGNETIPANKAYQGGFLLRRAGEVRVDIEVSAGQALDFYLMTEEQTQRAAKADPDSLRQGEDYLRRDLGVVGSGWYQDRYPAGRYYAIFFNQSGQTVTARITVRARG